MKSNPHNPLQELRIILREAGRITILTGAGVSAESGVPTFREAQTGLWSRYKPEELATPQAFQANPGLVWEWYQWRRNLVSQAQPNSGHFALAALESHVVRNGGSFCLITQNVDNLHQRAGSQNVIRLHGDVMQSKCFDCGIQTDEGESQEIQSEGRIPVCPHCGGLLRPDVIWFGENLSTESIHQAIQASQSCDVFFSIGTSSLVQPAASLPLLAVKKGATLIEINPHSTPITKKAHIVFQEPAGKIMPRLMSSIRSSMGDFTPKDPS